MPQVTVYIRKEDLLAWEGIERKAEFIHKALNEGGTLEGGMIGSTPAHIAKYGGASDTTKSTPIKIPEAIKAVQIKIDKRLSKLVDEGRQQLTNGLCKDHGTPLDDRGKCLQKGCKYA